MLAEWVTVCSIYFSPVNFILYRENFSKHKADGFWHRECQATVKNQLCILAVLFYNHVFPPLGFFFFFFAPRSIMSLVIFPGEICIARGEKYHVGLWVLEQAGVQPAVLVKNSQNWIFPP